MVDFKFLKENPDLAAKMRFEITGNDVINVIQSSVDIALKQVKPADETPISESEACEKYKLTRQTFYSMRKAGKITFRVLGNRIYYLESELIDEMGLIRRRATK